MTTPRRILVVEDDPKISQLLVDYLVLDGFVTQITNNGAAALQMFREYYPALIILDYMLPGLDGISVCKAIRLESEVPILMLTARVDEIDRLLGLDSGADDYVCKPFSPREVMARVRSLIRRSDVKGLDVSAIWQVDDAGLRIAWRRKWLTLTPVEFRLLRLLLSQPGRVFSRNQLLECAHTDTRDVIDRVIDSHMKNIRRKVDLVEKNAQCIASVYGVGYRFDPPLL
jgi:two-component system, OmpR family, response regulator BaeR